MEKNNSSTTESGGLSVIIVSYNVKDILSSCLDSLLIARGECDFPVEILVVDNASSDGTVGQLSPRYHQIQWIPSPQNLGFGAGCNRGADSATQSLFLFLNPDTLVEKNTLAIIRNFLLERGDAGAAGCRVLNSERKLEPAARRKFPTPKIAFYRMLGLSKIFPKSPKFGQYNLTYQDENAVQEVDSVSGSFLCVRAELFRRLKGFDSDFFMYGEDLDLCYRAKKLGFTNYYTPETSIVHFKGESAKTRPIRSLFHFYNAMVIFSRKHLELHALPRLGIYAGVFFFGALNFISHRGRRWQRWSLDLLIGNSILFLVTAAYFGLSGVPAIYQTDPGLYLNWHFWFSFFLWIGIGISGDYGPEPLGKKVKPAILASILAFYALGYFFHESSFSRIAFGITGILSFAALTGWRSFTMSSGYLGRFLGGKRKIVIAGINSRSLLFRDYLLAGRVPSMEFIGFVPTTPGEIALEGHTYICSFSVIPAMMDNLNIQDIVIILEQNAYQTALEFFNLTSNPPFSVKILVGDPKPGSVSLVDINYMRQTSSR